MSDLMKQLDKLERFKRNAERHTTIDPEMIQRRRGEWVRFEQVKTVIGQWVAEQIRARIENLKMF